MYLKYRVGIDNIYDISFYTSIIGIFEYFI